MRRSLFSVALLTAVVSSSASAQTRFFGFDGTGSSFTRATLVNSLAARNAFFGSLTGVGTEDFESLSGFGPLNLTFSGAGTATLSGSLEVITQASGTNGAGRYPISGSKFVETSAGNLTITFSEAIAAFGFYGVDIGDFADVFNINFYDGATLIDSWSPIPTNCPTCNGSAAFFGTINTAQTFTRVELVGAGSGGDVFGFDDMTIGSLAQVSTVPEPSTYALVASGLAVMGYLRRRRRA